MLSSLKTASSGFSSLNNVMTLSSLATIIHSFPLCGVSNGRLLGVYFGAMALVRIVSGCESGLAMLPIVDQVRNVYNVSVSI